MSEVTRGEFDLLRQIVSEIQHKIEAIDHHGTRGVGVVQVQLTELIKDLSELKLEFQASESARRTNRKWVAVFILTMLGTMGGIVGVIIELIGKVHG